MRMALKSHGTLRGLVTYGGSPEAQNDRIPETIYRYAKEKGTRTMQVGGQWSLGRILMEPLFTLLYNSHVSAGGEPPQSTRRHTHSNRDNVKKPRHPNQKFAGGARNATLTPKRCTTAQNVFQKSASLTSPICWNPMENSSLGPGSKASPAANEPNPRAHARNSTFYAGETRLLVQSI